MCTRPAEALMLELKAASASYGSVPAISNVSIAIGEGEAVGLLGANGAGKSTTMLAVGRGLMLKPRLLMLDEPSLGLAPVMTDVTFEKIGEIHKMGTAILLVEQNVSRALSLVARAYVLESGNVIMHGTSTELANNKQVQAAYLGI